MALLQTVEQHQRQLERLRTEQKSLQPDVERMQEREKKLEEVSRTVAHLDGPLQFSGIAMIGGSMPQHSRTVKQEA